MTKAKPKFTNRRKKQEPRNANIEEVTTPNEFKQFDIVTDCSDHHFVNSNSSSGIPTGKKKSNCFSNASSAVYKKIMQEWKILQENLPESIYVRAYEGRIDLLRAVIVGAAGTPYHHGLFFFDLSFPSTYATSPPQVHYQSHGLRMNPNLYTNGYVCLSLINTWDGNKQERWDRSTSTILQVLLSLQALVLNEEPYINEPGYEKSNPKYNQVDSMTYSNNVFRLSCKTMQYLIQTPPKNFETFVASHFRSCGSLVLRACNAYREGRVRVGCYKNDESSSLSSLTDVIEVSSKFKEDMDLIYLKLVEAFTGIGASMEDMNELKKVSPNKRKVTEKTVGRKSVKKIKKS